MLYQHVTIVTILDHFSWIQQLHFRTLSRLSWRKLPWCHHLRASRNFRKVLKSFYMKLKCFTQIIFCTKPVHHITWDGKRSSPAVECYTHEAFNRLPVRRLMREKGGARGVMGRPLRFNTSPQSPRNQLIIKRI